MAKRRILVLENKGTPWADFLEEFFDDTSSILSITTDARQAGTWIAAGGDAAFVNPQWLSQALAQKFKVLSQTRPDFCLFRLGEDQAACRPPAFADIFESPGSFLEFQRKLVRHLPLPEQVRILVVDDDPGIGVMIRDYMEKRVHPVFEVAYAPDGSQGLAALERQRPDVLILDLKMPVKDGREVYRRIREKGWEVPVIVFFDAVYGGELADIYRYGKPAIVEKGSRQSEMPEMMDLIKKMVFFG